MTKGGRVLIADDHPLTREGLALATRSALPGVAISSAGSVAEAITSAQQAPPDRMILLDLMLPDTRGFSGMMAIQHLLPRVPVVIVSARENPSLIEAAQALGAAGFLFKSMPLDALAGMLREIDDGRRVFPAGTGAANELAAIRDRINDLSPAQKTVLFALADGRANKVIAHELDVTEATVKAHLTAIYRRLGVTNRSQALIAVQPLFGAGENGENM